MRNTALRRMVYIFLFLQLFLTPSIAQNIEDIKKEIQERIENGIQNGRIAIGDIYLFNNTNLGKYYIDRGFEPAWMDNNNSSDLINILMDSYDVGLNPEDYHLERITDLVNKINNGKATPDIYADLDLLMTDAASLYANHLNYGKTMQSDLRKSWNVPENPMPQNPAKLFEKALTTKNLAGLFESLGPQHVMYKNMVKGLSEYREIAENGGWPTIPVGETLKKGMVSDRIPVIRKRLLITLDLDIASAETDNQSFDEALEKSVKHFQLRHNLIQDGILGKNTVAEMNVSVEKRIDQIRINLERGRWVMHKLEPDFLMVNIARFTLMRITNGKIVYSSPVIVGKTFHQSPIFKAQMNYIVINPTWTVPYSIASKETLPKLKKDPGYLPARNMIIMDRNGKELDPSNIDFSKYSTSNFPFTIRQEPGPNNALGEVKFMFPNPYSVYVHDTPNRSLFSREERAFSHGCIRLQNKWELLMSLMDEPEVWNMSKINEILASDETTNINLPEPIDILILYWTAGEDDEGNIFFYKDIYDRDKTVLSELNEPWNYETIQ